MKRFAVIFALFLMSVIFYIDRAAIASTLKPMSQELGFSILLSAHRGCPFEAILAGPGAETAHST